MADTSSLLSRIDAEFHEVDEKISQYREEKSEEFHERQDRLEQFVEICTSLQDVWRPRFETLAERFKDKVEVVPSITKSRRSATIRFHSRLATFNMTLSAMTDVDVRHFVLDCTLEVLPILMKFEKNQQLELPLDDVNPEVVGQWIDDRIVDAVKVYLQVHQNSYYLKGHMVRDPIANIEFPKYAAATELEWKGSTFYFISEEARDAFKRENHIA